MAPVESKECVYQRSAVGEGVGEAGEQDRHTDIRTQTTEEELTTHNRQLTIRIKAPKNGFIFLSDRSSSLTRLLVYLLVYF